MPPPNARHEDLVFRSDNPRCRGRQRLLSLQKTAHTSGAETATRVGRTDEVGARWGGALPLHLVASNVALDINLSTISGESRPLEEWVTTFHLASVVLDPFTNESSWVLKSAIRILDAFRGADVRVNLVLTCTADEAKQFLGPIADQFLVFCDADRSFVKGLGVATLPAFVFVRGDGSVEAAAEGWNPAEWRTVAKTIAENTSWIAPTIPVASDPSPFHGTPALG